MRPRLVAHAIACCAALAGCGGRGIVTFHIEAPEREDLSPFSDARRESAAFFDELTRQGLGTAFNLRASSGVALPMGDVPVGRYDVRMLVSGSSQLIGLARTPAVMIAAGETVEVTLHARKPIGFWGVHAILGDVGALPPPERLMAIDTTLPRESIVLRDVVPGQDPDSHANATAGSRDGQYLLLVGDGLFAPVRTSDMMIVGLVGLLDAAGRASTTLRPHRVVVSADDRWFAVLSDQGVHIGSLDALRARSLPSSLPIIPLADVVAAEFSPGAASLTVLTGPSWESLECPAPRTASRIYEIPVESAGNPGAPRDAPAGTTDIAWHPRLGLLQAVACGDGVITSGDGAPRTILPGTRIQKIVVAGDLVYGVEGDVKFIRVEFDPEDPSQRNVMQPHAKLGAGSDLARSETSYRILPYNPRFRVVGRTGNTQYQKKLEPLRVDVYGIAVNPDASKVTLLQRVRYAVPGFDPKLVEILPDPRQPNDPTFRAYIAAERDVYSVVVVDVGRGTVGYQDPTGFAEATPCRITAQECRGVGPLEVCARKPEFDESCDAPDGYAPGGLSVLLGHN